MALASLLINIIAKPRLSALVPIDFAGDVLGHLCGFALHGLAVMAPGFSLAEGGGWGTGLGFGFWDRLGRVFGGTGGGDRVGMGSGGYGGIWGGYGGGYGYGYGCGYGGIWEGGFGARIWAEWAENGLSYHTR